MHVHLFFCQNRKALLTTSCTDALELASLLCEVEPGDEVILASYGFVSTANAFALRGASLVFADSQPDHPNVSLESLETLITPRTRVIALTHYAGVAVDMDPLLALAAPQGIRVVEDAAQGVEAFYRQRSLGTMGDLGTLSFHETKNIQCGEGGMLIVNDPAFVNRAEIVWEKGTNRASFFRGEVDKYSWVDLGSSYAPSEIMGAVLWAQLENLEAIQARRMDRWTQFMDRLNPLETDGLAILPRIPEYAKHNAHIFYLVTRDLGERSRLIEHLKGRGIHAVFHYQSLHKSPYFTSKHRGHDLPNANRFSDCLVRLPLWPDLMPGQVDHICDEVLRFYGFPSSGS